MFKLLSASAGIALIALSTFPAGAAPTPKTGEPNMLRVHYSISLIGLPLGTVQVSGVIGPTSYRLEANGKLTGLAGVIVNTKAAATATGTLAGGRVDPATFAATAATSRDTLTIRMAMAHGVATGVEIVPKYEQKPDRVPLTASDERNIIDPLSSFFMAVPGVADPVGPAACDRTLPVFDGGVRFNVTLAYAGLRQVNGAGYSGPVAVCSARYMPIAGHRPDRPATKFMINNKEMEVWLAPVGRTRFVVPYRVSVMTMLGTTVIEATDFNVSPLTKAAALKP